MAPPARRPIVMGTITALGDLTDSLSSSRDAPTDLDMPDVDWSQDDTDEMAFDISYRHLTFSNDTAPLRGSAVYRRPSVPWLAKTVVAPPNQFQVKVKAEDGNDGIDYEDLDGLSSDDGYSTSSDWDGYGSLPLVMDEYDEAAARLEGSEDWNEEQRKLHKLIYMRGLHPMMPSWWRVSFKMWGVTQPQLDDVFTPQHSKKRVAIHAYGNEVAGKSRMQMPPPFIAQTLTPRISDQGSRVSVPPFPDSHRLRGNRIPEQNLLDRRQGHPELHQMGPARRRHRPVQNTAQHARAVISSGLRR